MGRFGSAGLFPVGIVHVTWFAVVPFAFFEVFEEREGPLARVDVGGEIPIVAGVDDGQGQIVADRDHAAGAVRVPDAPRIAGGPLLHEVAIDIEAADLLVDVEKLSRGDGPAVQGRARTGYRRCRRPSARSPCGDRARRR